MATPTQVLQDINSTIINHIDLVRQPTTGRFISKQEFDSIPNIHRSSRKTVGMTDARISIGGEILESHRFKTCIPIIIQDQLNEYAAMGHFYAGERIAKSAGNIDGALHSGLPLGSLVVKLLQNNNSYDIRGVKSFIQASRSDIIDIEVVTIPDVDAYFDVVYDPENKKAYIQSLSYGDQVYEISGFDFGLTKKLPEQYLLMRQYFAMEIGNTFFL